MQSTMKTMVFLISLVLLLAGCENFSKSDSSVDNTSNETAPAVQEADMDYGQLAGVEIGMGESGVRDVLGNPDKRDAYTTGKGWIPFYYGSDTSRETWYYKGKGHIDFSRNRYSGALKVIKVRPE